MREEPRQYRFDIRRYLSELRVKIKYFINIESSDDLSVQLYLYEHL